jgi:predicted permease
MREWATSFWLRLKTLFHRRRLERDLQDELAFHVAMRGDTADARKRFGNRTAWTERTRDLWTFPTVDSLLQDVQYAARVFRRSPLFFTGAVAVLALGIGANSAIFSLVHAVLLQPLPYRNPEEIVMVWDADPTPDGKWRRGHTTSTALRYWVDGSAGVLSDLGVMRMSTRESFDLLLPDGAQRLNTALVTPNFFSILGARPALGRLFSEQDSSADVVVISHGIWQRAFGGDLDVIGRSVTLVNGIIARVERAPRLYTIIGVLPPEFRFTYPVETEIWAVHSWPTVWAAPRGSVEFMGAVGRLAPGVSLQAATARMRTIPTSDRKESKEFTQIEPITEWVVGETRPSLLILAGVAALLLVIACATVANGLLVRLAERRRELAVRASLGAGRARLTRQLLTEGLVLSLAGAIGGSLLAAVIVPIFRAVVPIAVPRADLITVDPRILLTAAGAAALVTVLTSLAPALQAARVNVAPALKGAELSASASASTVRWRFGFVALQATIATALLIGSALLLISFWRLHRVDLGFDGSQVITAEIRLLGKRFHVKTAIERFQQDVIRRVRAIPGVTEAAVTSAVPFRGTDWYWSFRRTGATRPLAAHRRDVDPAYFSVMRLTLLRGRLLAETDTSGSEPVVVISESLARQAFPGEDPIGKQFDLRPPRTVVGVVKDVHSRAIDESPLPAIYEPRAQNSTELVCLVLRSKVDQKQTIAAVRRAVHETDPTVPAMDFTTVDAIVSGSIADRRFYTTTTTAFSVLALLLTAGGLIVVVSRSVAERRRELAIRTALGARSRQLSGMVIRQGAAPVILGTVLGVSCAWFATRVLEAFVFQISVRDVRVYLAAASIISAVAALACYFPARRAASVQPASVLRAD